MRSHLLLGKLLLLGFLQWSLTGLEAAAPPKAKESPTRYEKDIAAFESSDVTHAPPQSAVLFVGGSSIRLWKTIHEDFPNTVVIQRGFGGAKIADATYYLDRIITPYHPRQIFVYAGDNDIAGNLSPAAVLDHFTQFNKLLQKRLPEVQVYYIAIKPSPARFKYLVPTHQANDLIRRYASTQSRLHYIDVFQPMLDADGNPRSELFEADKLHLNRDGYQLWVSQIRPWLENQAGQKSAQH